MAAGTSPGAFSGYLNLVKALKTCESSFNPKTLASDINCNELDKTLLLKKGTTTPQQSRRQLKRRRNRTYVSPSFEETIHNIKGPSLSFSNQFLAEESYEQPIYMGVTGAGDLSEYANFSDLPAESIKKRIARKKLEMLENDKLNKGTKNENRDAIDLFEGQSSVTSLASTLKETPPTAKRLTLDQSFNAITANVSAAAEIQIKKEFFKSVLDMDSSDLYGILHFASPVQKKDTPSYLPTWPGHYQTSSMFTDDKNVEREGMETPQQGSHIVRSLVEASESKGNGIDGFEATSFSRCVQSKDIGRALESLANSCDMDHEEHGKEIKAAGEWMKNRDIKLVQEQSKAVTETHSTYLKVEKVMHETVDDLKLTRFNKTYLILTLGKKNAFELFRVKFANSLCYTKKKVLRKLRAINERYKLKVRNEAATKIRAIYAVIVAKKVMLYKRKNHSALNDKKANQIRKRVEKRSKSARLLWRGWVVFKFRRAVWKMILRNKAARLIIINFRNMNFAKLIRAHFRNQKLKNQVATKINACCRMHLAKKSYKYMRKKHRSETRISSLLKLKFAVDTNFQFFGAATIIQRWFRKIPYRIRRHEMEKQIRALNRLAAIVRARRVRKVYRRMRRLHEIKKKIYGRKLKTLLIRTVKRMKEDIQYKLKLKMRLKKQEKTGPRDKIDLKKYKAMIEKKIKDIESRKAAEDAEKKAKRRKKEKDKEKRLLKVEKAREQVEKEMEKKMKDKGKKYERKKRPKEEIKSIFPKLDCFKYIPKPRVPTLPPDITRDLKQKGMKKSKKKKSIQSLEEEMLGRNKHTWLEKEIHKIKLAIKYELKPAIEKLSIDAARVISAKAEKYVSGPAMTYVYKHTEETRAKIRIRYKIFKIRYFGDDGEGEYLDFCATKIQTQWRMRLARKRVARIKMDKRLACVTKIQFLFKKMLKARKRLKACKRIQMCWKAHIKWKNRFNLSAIKIQTKWRMFICFRSYSAHVLRVRPAIPKIQKMMRGRLHRKRYYLKGQAPRMISEWVLGGQIYYNLTVEVERRRQLLWGTRDTEDSQYEIQKIFEYYATNRSFGNVVELSKLAKLVKDSPLIMHDSGVDLLFVRILKRNQREFKGFLYSDFLEALMWMANEKYPNMEAWNKFLGEDARLIRLFDECLFVSKMSKQILNSLEPSQKAKNRGLMRIEMSIRKIQTVFRARFRRKKYIRLIREQKEKQERERKNEIIKSIQRMFRGFKARIMVRNLALKRYEKYIDAETKREYWFNPETRTAFWQKPGIFGKLDVMNVILLPDPDRQFCILCQQCNDVVAPLYCIDCAEFFCREDSDSFHSRGKRLDHTIIKTDVCVNCEFSVASKKCLTCDDIYCDTCYFYLHAKGQLQIHSWTALTIMCSQCSNYMAHVECTHQDCKFGRFCRRCDVERHNTTGEASYHTRRNLVYHPSRYVEHKKLEAQTMEIEKQKGIFENAMAKMKVIAEHESAIQIQKVIRGFLTRKKLKVQILKREMFLEARKIDNIQRRTKAYQLLFKYGMAPIFESDTTEERVLKTYPERYHITIRDIIDGHWSLALEMIREREEFSRNRSKGTWLGFIQDKYIGAKTAAHLKIAQSNLERIQYKFKKLQNAKRSGEKVSKLERERIDTEINSLKPTLRKVKKEAAIALENRRMFEEKRTQMQGPNRFKEWVEDGIKHGVKYPFKVEAFHGKKFIKPPVDCLKAFKGKEVLQIGPESGEWSVNFEVEVGGYIHYMTEYRNAFQGGKRPKVNLTGEYLTIFIDHEWCDEDMKDLIIRRIPPPLPSQRRKVNMLKKLRENRVYQGALWLCINIYHLSENLVNMLSAVFDDESKTFADVQRAAKIINETKKKLHRKRMTVVDTQYGFGVVAKYREIIRDSKKNYEKGLIYYRQLRHYIDAFQKSIDPYAQWSKSNDKDEIRVVWIETEEEDILGTVMIDRDAPVGVLRTTIKRKLYQELNEKKGASFLFMVGGNIFPGSDENDMTTKELCPEVYDEVDHELNFIVKIVENKNKKYEAVPYIAEDNGVTMTADEMKELQIQLKAIDEGEDIDEISKRPTFENSAIEFEYEDDTKEPEVTEFGQSSQYLSMWEEYFDETGIAYYYNNQTGESQYEIPDGFYNK